MSVTWDARNLDLLEGENLIYCLRVGRLKMAMVAAANVEVAQTFNDGFMPPRILKGRAGANIKYVSGQLFQIIVSAASMENTDTVDIDHALMVGPELKNANILPAFDAGNTVNETQKPDGSITYDWVPLGVNIPAINNDFKLTRIPTRVQM